MAVHPQPSDFETRTNATYEALLWALSRPGLIRRIPKPGQGPIIEALIDGECAVHCADPSLAAAASRTGARIVGPEAADFVFTGAPSSADALDHLRRGTDLHPEAGATLVCAAELEKGEYLRLTGPGCDGAVEQRVGGLPGGFWQRRARLLRYPMGFDVILVDGDRVLGVPRSTVVEVL